MNASHFRLLISFFITLLSSTTAFPQIGKEVISSIPLRNIGPAFMTGRISDVAKDPVNRSTWYVATSSSNVWKTTNNGTTWKPIFDNYNSYSTGCIAIDTKSPNKIWLGTGENQSQRSVGWGDGIYLSEDGGKSWVNKGLKTSEHIGKILIDPEDSNVLIVAAQGPLWKAGGERGVYRSDDGGNSWVQTLEISENTGAADLAFDPNDPNIIYATTYQRRRHVGMLVAGGPESRIYKSSDNGKSWQMLKKGLPQGNLGRIAIAVSPQKSNVVYAHISGEEGSNGFYRSEDYGNSWGKTSDYAIVDPQYYGEIYCDPNRFDHVYVMDTYIHFTTDGGKKFERLNTRFKHVDNHSMLFDESDPDYMMVGCDGGIYESWDYGQSWKYHDNLPITQFYRVGIDNDFPFYNVYGGTQDNSTLYGPSQTISRHGITNADWNLALGGDGFQARIDPEDPNTVYCQSQYAGIVRYDKASGHRTELQPQVSSEEDPLRWHWDSPLIISPHNSKRIYFAAQKLFQSDDRGDTWKAISGDLSRGEDRNERKMMGKLWPPEAVWKNVFTSPYGTIVSLSESPIQEGLIAVGTDDGQIQITQDNGQKWKKINQFPGVPPKAYVADILLSHHETSVIYAVLNNHKEGDYAPYILKSENLGESWKQINAGIEAPHACWTIAEDHVSANLLFAGTEFGLFSTINGGANWVQMKGNMPTIPVRDLEIQKRENDLVCATFGRGMMILDDFTPLRSLAEEQMSPNKLFDITESWSFIPKGDKGYSLKGSFGNSFYSAPNPMTGPALNIYLADKFEMSKEIRKRQEKNGLQTYPKYETLKTEDLEEKALIYAMIKDENGQIVSRTPVKNKKGFQRVEAQMSPTIYSIDGKNQTTGPAELEGNFTAQIFITNSGVSTSITEAKPFTIKRLPLSREVPSSDYHSFHKEVAKCLAEVISLREGLEEKLSNLSEQKSRALNQGITDRVKGIEKERLALLDMQYELLGDQTSRKRAQYAHPGILQKVRRVYGNMWNGLQITNTHRASFKEAKSSFDKLKAAFDSL